MTSSSPFETNQSSAELHNSDKGAGQPSKHQFYEAKGNFLLQQKKIDDAVESYQLALKISPCARLYLKLAHIFKQQQKENAYLEAQFQALLLDPSLVAVADVHQLVTSLQTYYQEAIQSQPEDAYLYANLAEVYKYQCKPEDAIVNYQKAIYLEPSLVNAHAQLAEVQAQQQQWREAIVHYIKALTNTSNMLPVQVQKEVLKGLGRAYLEKGKQLKTQGNIEETVQAYLQALQYDPKLLEAYNRLRYNLMRYEALDNASILDKIVKTCLETVKQFPDFPPAHIVMGYALTKQGEREAAIECFSNICKRTIRSLQPDLNLCERSECCGPAYIVIGAEKSGTSSLYHYLRRHPAILPPIEKEIDFFDLEYEQGLDWYLAHFPPIPKGSEWITGETSANYLYSDKAPQRISKHFPHTKLIVILRHPVERTISRYNMMVRNGSEKRTFEAAVQHEIKQLTRAKTGDDISKQALDRNRHLGNSLYYHHIKRWLVCFPREQLLVIKSEDLFQSPDETLNTIYSELGLPHHSEQEYPKYNGGEYEAIASETYQTLSDFLAPDIRKLEKLLGCSFDWKLVQKSRTQNSD